MKNGKIRTYPIKSLTIFLAIAFVVSTAMVVVFALPFMNSEMWVIRILVWVFCGIFAIASLIVLVYQLFFYVEIKNECFYKHFLFGYKKIPIKEIERIRNIDGFYYIYVNNRKIAYFAANTKESQEMIVYLEKAHVKIDW